jgi:cyclopropane fatty-acyl-phospholipid synthase-like methyltransferase
MKKITDAVDMFNESAKIYEEKYMDVTAYSKPLDRFSKELKSEATVLEFGCGPGNITRYLLNKRGDLKILGSDLAPEMVKLAKKNCPEADFEVIDVRDLSIIDSCYDGVLAGFCLPYLTKEEVSLFFKEIIKVLNPEGILYLSAIQNENEESEIKTSSSGDRLRIHYYNKGYLKRLLETSGFGVIDTFDSSENGDNEIIFVAQLK